MDFKIGCNYWASHAGVYMWRNWDSSVVEADLKLLSQYGVKVIRAFPLWCDFQPLTKIRANGSYEIRLGDKPLNKLTPEGLAGVDPVMIQRFEEFVLLAKKYDMELIIPLITGWMSGRMFFPDAFDDRSPITDSEMIKWELRFVKYFVNRFKGYDNIIAWESGNETNVMVQADPMATKDSFWVWLCGINQAIRSADPSRPVIAGMHGLTLQKEGTGITISETGELCDMMTVHPYPAFVPHCFVDGFDSMKCMLHAATESTYYSDITGKPCLCEEIGQLSNSVGCEETVAAYLKATLYSLWSHGFPGLLWWCAFDQTALEFPPYDWCACERELGLLRNDGTPKQIATELLNFQSFLASQAPLAPYRRDAVCVLSKDQDNWGVAYSVNLLCKQAGYDVTFVDGEDPLPSADFYLVPSLSGNALPRRTWVTLMRAVENGATAYISWQDAILSDIEGITGLKVCNNTVRKEQCVNVKFSCMDMEIPLTNERRLLLAPQSDADILGTESNGNPAFVYHPCGKGGVYFLTFPLEATLADLPEAFCNTNYYRIYQYMLRPTSKRVVVEKTSPMVTITEHPEESGACTIVATNYGSSAAYKLKLQEGWTLGSVQWGNVVKSAPQELELAMDAISVCRFKVVKRDS